MKDVVLVRVDGGNENSLGMGHMYRCLNLVHTLDRKKQFKIIFLIKKYPDMVKFVAKKGFPVIDLGRYRAIQKELEKIRSLKPKLFIADIRDIDNKYIKAIKKNDCLFVYIDDLGRHDLRPDLLINPGPAKRFLNYPVSKEVRYLLGLKYFILNKKTGLKKRSRGVSEKTQRIIFSFGGADPKDCTRRILKYIKYLPKKIKCVFVLGPAYKNKKRVMAYVKDNKFDNIVVKKNVKDMISLFRSADIAVVSGGDTLIEAMYSRIPTMVVPTIWYEDAIAEDMESQGYILKASQVEHLRRGEFINKLSCMIADYDKRLKMHRLSKDLVDGFGADRISGYLEDMHG